MECRWLIKVPDGLKARISFSSFDVEPHQECKWDYLDLSLILNAFNSSTLLGRFCGDSLDKTAPNNFTILNDLLLHFHTDVVTEGTGFQMKVTLVEGELFCNMHTSTE